jgi:uncharacterized protein (DUF1501 family)
MEKRVRRSFLALAGLLAATLAASACDNGPAPTAPTPGPTVTDTFTGTLTLNGSQTFSFNQTTAGNVSATITALNPSDKVIGFQLGTWDTVTCRAVTSNDLATINSVLSGQTQSSASLCLKVHDPNGALTDASVTFTVTVSHE